MSRPNISAFAAAKINLNLHVTGRRADGYHLLDSLVAFADIGDEIEIEPAREFAFHLAGPFADKFSPQENSSGPDSKNLVVRAALGMARLAGKAPDFKITLVKNLPLGGGIGGGSADAAAVMRGLMILWGMDENAPGLMALAEELGSDVPVCLIGRAARMQGIGEQITPLVSFPDMPAVLVHPGKHSSTVEIFRRYREDFSSQMPMPEGFETPEDLTDFLRETGNDLTRAACEAVPEIKTVIEALATQKGCILTRMSGSGSCCFGLFQSQVKAGEAAEKIQAAHPGYWVRACRITGGAKAAPPAATGTDRPAR